MMPVAPAPLCASTASTHSVVDVQISIAGTRFPASVNKLKLVKRQMYGRANFDLLRLRVLHVA